MDYESTWAAITKRTRHWVSSCEQDCSSSRDSVVERWVSPKRKQFEATNRRCRRQNGPATSSDDAHHSNNTPKTFYSPNENLKPSLRCSIYTATWRHTHSISCESLSNAMCCNGLWENPFYRRTTKIFNKMIKKQRARYLNVLHSN